MSPVVAKPDYKAVVKQPFFIFSAFIVFLQIYDLVLESQNDPASQSALPWVEQIDPYMSLLIIVFIASIWFYELIEVSLEEGTIHIGYIGGLIKRSHPVEEVLSIQPFRKSSISYGYMLNIGKKMTRLPGSHLNSTELIEELSKRSGVGVGEVSEKKSISMGWITLIVFLLVLLSFVVGFSISSSGLFEGR